MLEHGFELVKARMGPIWTACQRDEKRVVRDDPHR